MTSPAIPSEHDGESSAPVIDMTPLRDPEAIAARDKLWLETVYQADEPQLTFRAGLTGVVLGSVLGASNLYIGLKIGWSFGMSITASVLAFAIFSSMRALFPSMKPFSMLENNTSQTAASAAAYMSSAGLVSSIPAMTMLRNEGMPMPELSAGALMLWLLALSALGVVVAIPLKRNMINAEQLRFPSGTVCAETIRTMHAAGASSIKKARSLVYGGLFAAVMKFLFDCKLSVLKKLPEMIAVPGKIRGHAMAAWSIGLNTSILLYAAGAIMGMKVATSLGVGALFNYTVLGPWLLDHGVLRVASEEIASKPELWKAFAASAAVDHAIPVKSAEMLHVVLRSKWSVWPGTAMMVSASLVTFAFRWRTVARAFSGIGALFTGKKAKDPLESVEVPSSWFAIGLVVFGAACVYMQTAWFGVPILEGIVSVFAAFVLSVVAARATGETDVTPIGAMGKITQLLFGVLVPGNAAANLMTATVTAGAASHSADLLTEVKTGYLLGGSPRKQFWAQMLGVGVGALTVVPAYMVIAKPEKLGKELAAPAAVAWASVAKLLKDGWQNLPQMALYAIGVGVAIGVLIALCDELLPAKLKRFVPSATGLGIAMVIDANDSLAMFAGALIADALYRYRKQIADNYIVSVSSGLIAGEGLMGLGVIVLRMLHWLPEE